MNTRPMRAAILVAIAFLTGVGAVELPPTLSLVSRVQAQDFVARVNNAYSVIGGTKRSDTVLLPVLAKMEKAPASVATPDKAALLPASSPDFAAAAAWAQAASQKAAIEALNKVTEESDWKKSFGFGQPYGAEGVSPEIIRSGLYSELGDPPILGAARHQYLPALDALVCLVNVEATRLAAEGKPTDAVNLLIDLTYLARQIADRQFFAEVQWGFQQIADAQERIRDITYRDLRGDKKYDIAAIPDQIKKLSEEGQGYMDLNRIKFPDGNRAAAEQLLARFYNEQGDVNDAVFASTLSRMGSSEHPLRLFSVAAQYQDAAQAQENVMDAHSHFNAVYNDFRRRWAMPYHDPARSIVTEYSKLPKGRSAAVESTTPDFNELIELRHRARVELGGTRMSLALFAFTLNNNNIPRAITAVRPRWMSQVEIDLYDRESMLTNSRAPLQYFIPRGTASDSIGAHDMQVYTDNGETNFRVALHSDTFVLFSVGTDYLTNGAKRVQNTTKVVQGADYLLWPPVISLYRQHLIDRGDLKITGN